MEKVKNIKGFLALEGNEEANTTTWALYDSKALLIARYNFQPFNLSIEVGSIQALGETKHYNGQAFTHIKLNSGSVTLQDNGLLVFSGNIQLLK